MASIRMILGARVLTATALVFLFCSSPATRLASAQVGGSPPDSLGGPPASMGGPPASTMPGRLNPLSAPVPTAIPPRMAAASALARENDRQRKLVEDSDRLLALATELHAEVGKTDKNILSVDVVRRAEEIEKLARSVKDRMRAQ